MTKHRKSGKKSNATKLAHKKFRWHRQLRADPEMSRLGMRICLEISDRSNLDYDGAVVIAQDTWAERYDVCRETFNRALRRIVALGHLESIRRGRDRPNAYRMVIRDEVQTAFDFGKSAPSKASDDVMENVTSYPSRCDVFVPDDMTVSVTRDPLSLPGPLKRPQEERERNTSANALDNSSPAGGSPPLDAGPPRRQEASPTTAPPPRRESPTARAQPAEREDPGDGEKFRELCAIWQRGHARDDTPDTIAAARQAFVRALEEGADPADILDGAATWFAAFETGDGVRYLPALPNWLIAHGWEKPPPKKRRAANGHRSNGYAKPDMFKITLEAGGYRENPDGSMYWPGDNPNSGAGDDDEPFGTSMWGGGR
jgi:hypothetical protein